MARKGLGKGLGTLFDSGGIADIEADASGAEISEIKLSLIEPNRNQPRKSFDPEKIDALAKSISEHGLIQPIIISPIEGGRYRIVAGERRWRAAKKAGLSTVPTVIREYSDEETAQIALIENLQREDLNPIEEALGYRTLINDFSLTQEAVSEKIGKSRSAVANSLRLLSLDENIQKLLIDGKLTGGHARALLSVEDEELRNELAKKIIDEGLNVRQAEALSKKLGKKRPQRRKKTEDDVYSIELERLQNRLSSGLGTKVKISHNKNRGKIEIEYYGNDDLERILSMFSVEY